MRERTKKLRGSKTHGYGGKKKHRGKGSKGGRGRAGKHKHIKLHWGRRGFVRHGIRREKKIINVEDLNLIESDEINLTEMGFEKLLGSGKVKRAIKVIVKEATPKAIEKIEEAGGEVIVG